MTARTRSRPRAGRSPSGWRAWVLLIAVATLLVAPLAAQDGPTQGGVTPSGGADELPVGLSPNPVVAPGATEGAFDEAVSAYRDGDYARSLSLFAELARSERDPARLALLHANAGTAAARAERFGVAVWHLESALRFAPRDATARRNLDMLRAEIGQGAVLGEDLGETLQRLPLQVTEGEARWVVASLAAASLLLLVVRRGGRGGAPLTALIVLTALASAGWYAADRAARRAEASREVVLVSTAVHGEPSGEGRVLFRIDPGAVVRAEETRGGWTLVETTAGGRGWLLRDHVRAVGG